MNPVIKIFKNIDDLSHGFAMMLIDYIKEKETEEYFTLALSGGSTPKSIFKYLSINFKDIIPWERIRVFWGDERCVEPENEESNFRMASENLLDCVPILKKNIFRIKGENDPIVESQRYSEIVKQHVPLIPGIPQFDIVMLGLGDDGHTASLFPGNEPIFKSNKLFEATENPYTKQKRITATFKLINQASIIAFFVTGKSKAGMVSHLLENEKGVERFPFALVKPVGGEVVWFIDELAASEIKRNKV